MTRRRTQRERIRYNRQRRQQRFFFRAAIRETPSIRLRRDVYAQLERIWPRWPFERFL